MTDLFIPASKFTLAAEGVFSDQAVDPGGPTKWGCARNAHPEITDAQWAAWTQADSIALFRSKYWDAHRCGEMPWRWALLVFDGEINQGSVIKWAQASLGLVMDGAVGDKTLAAMNSAQDEAFNIFVALRLLSYTHDSAFLADGKGWFKRIIASVTLAATGP